MGDQSSGESQIRNFFRGQNVFITGGTGFMGKVLIEKLLRSCPELRRVYILIRPKKNAQVQERVEKLLTSWVFDVLSGQLPNYKEKVVGIEGDAAEPGLGISPEDRQLLTREVSVVIHMAAAVRFDETLPMAFRINVHSVKEVIDLCRECTNLRVGVYVSTAYSNCVRQKIDEVLYDPPLTYEDCIGLEKIIATRKWSPEELEAVTKVIIGKWPNTYSFTKAIAENVVGEYAKDLPFTIVRPSIVIGTYKEPEPGYVDNLLGPSGLFVGIGIGAIHCVLIDSSLRCDLVPCDLAIDAIIAATWKTATMPERNNVTPVYNYVNQKPIIWRNVYKGGFSAFFKKPSIHIAYYPFLLTTTSKTLFNIYQFFLALLPALIIDMIIRIKGQKPIMYDVYKKGMRMNQVLNFFITREWDFGHQNLKTLWQSMNERDRELYPFLHPSFSWAGCFDGYVGGLRKIYTNYLINIKAVKFKEDTVEAGKKHLRKLYIVHLIVTTVFFGFWLFLFWKIFSSVLHFTSISQE